MLRPLKDAKKEIKLRMEENLAKKLSDNEFEARYKERVDNLIKNLRIPIKYQKVLASELSKDIEECLPFSKESKKHGIYLWGGVGTGKTHTLYALQKVFSERLTRFSIVNMTELLANIRSSFDSNDKLDILDSIFNAYDDVGAEKESEWTGEQIYRLVNELYEHEKPFVFTSNLSLGELAKRCGVQGDRIASRIAEMAEVIELKGNDRRI